nr:MAG TPA: hypothetical protein [Caudoviricetes sp.]
MNGLCKEQTAKNCCSNIFELFFELLCRCTACYQVIKDYHLFAFEEISVQVYHIAKAFTDNMQSVVVFTLTATENIHISRTVLNVCSSCHISRKFQKPVVVFLLACTWCAHKNKITCLFAIPFCKQVNNNVRNIFCSPFLTVLESVNKSSCCRILRINSEKPFRQILINIICLHKLEFLFAEGGEELFTFHLLPCREFFLFPSVGCSLFTLRAIQPGTSSPQGKELQVKIRNTHFRQLTKVRKAAEDFLCRNNRVVLDTRTPGVPLLSKNEFLTDDKIWLSTGESRRLGEYNLFNEIHQKLPYY